MKVPQLSFNDGHTIPQLGFGTYKIEKEETYYTVFHALKNGYRHVDTAEYYKNEAEVGNAVKDFEDHVFVTTKYFNQNSSEHGYDDAKKHFDSSFAALKLDYIDLYLIHWPVENDESYVNSWKALIDIQKTEKVKSIGVSNFSIHNLNEIIAKTNKVPAVNQIEMHPHKQQEKLREFHKQKGIITEAWSPLDQGNVLDDKLIKDLAKNYEKSPAQIVLRWFMQLGVVTFPKSETPERIVDNINIFDFKLSDDDMNRIKSLNQE